MSYGTVGTKRQREANRDRKKKEKEERLRRNRSMAGAQAGDSSDQPPEGSGSSEEVRLEDINISGVAPRGPKGSYGPTKLFVGGLSWDTTGESLRAAFEKFGPLREAQVVMDRDTGRSRGFGLVNFENPLHAAQAISEMNGASLDGRTLRVNPADR